MYKKGRFAIVCSGTNCTSRVECIQFLILLTNVDRLLNLMQRCVRQTFRLKNLRNLKQDN